MPNCFTSSKSESRVAHMIVQRATASSTKTDELRTRTRRLRGQQRKRPAADRRPEYRGSSTRKLEYKWCTARVKSTQCTCTECRAEEGSSGGGSRSAADVRTSGLRQAQEIGKPSLRLDRSGRCSGRRAGVAVAATREVRWQRANVTNRVVSHCSMRSCCHRRLPKPIAHVSMYE